MVEVNVPEEFQNISVEQWAAGALAIMSLIAGSLGTEDAWTDKQIDESLSKLAASAPKSVATNAALLLISQMAGQ